MVKNLRHFIFLRDDFRFIIVSPYVSSLNGGMQWSKKKACLNELSNTTQAELQTKMINHHQ